MINDIVIRASLIAGTVAACVLFLVGMAGWWAGCAVEHILGRDDAEVGERP